MRAQVVYVVALLLLCATSTVSAASVSTAHSRVHKSTTVKTNWRMPNEGAVQSAEGVSRDMRSYERERQPEDEVDEPVRNRTLKYEEDEEGQDADVQQRIVKTVDAPKAKLGDTPSAANYDTLTKVNALLQKEKVDIKGQHAKMQQDKEKADKEHIEEREKLQMELKSAQEELKIIANEKDSLKKQTTELRTVTENLIAQKKKIEEEKAHLELSRKALEDEKADIRAQLKAIYGELIDAQKRYQEALENPDMSRWLGKHIDLYVPEEVKMHTAKYSPVLSQVGTMSWRVTGSLQTSLEQRLSDLMPARISSYAPFMAWLMTYGVILIPLLICFFAMCKMSSRVPSYKVLIACHLFYAIFFALAFINTVILGEDALLVQATTYHDAIESLLFMLGVGYIVSAFIQTYQMFTLKSRRLFFVISYASIALYQYMSLGFMYRFMWRPLVRNQAWQWPAPYIYLFMSLAYAAFVAVVTYVRDGVLAIASKRKSIDWTIPTSPIEVQMKAHRVENRPSRTVFGASLPTFTAYYEKRE